jgi:hypothetical protein
MQHKTVTIPLLIRPVFVEIFGLAARVAHSPIRHRDQAVFHWSFDEAQREDDESTKILAEL